ncbi:MAG: M48 family metallopeptidase [Cellvibrio sp.]|nr:M48 family metallopeptidase [Cellvibrio sp.]
MNFFEQQDLARKKTRHLIFLLAMAVISLITITTLFVAVAVFYARQESQEYTYEHVGIFNSVTPQMFGIISLIIILIILGGSLYKFFQIKSGGKTVAEALGGNLLNGETKIFAERKVLNVVEEMAIAAGVPVPPVYVIEDESVNAFAAGHSSRDAVIGITRGAIELLNREELQGVIAHEFSHVFHGDMKLNMRLVAILHGILLLGLIGQFLVRNGFYSRSRSSKDNSKFAIIAFGLGLMVIGYAGTFFGNLIKAAVSRQREFLADASSVQYTRNPQGIGNALKKLGGHSGSSQLSSPNAAEFSHLYFADGISHFLSLMDTHPKLQERIKRIEPRWNGEFIYAQKDTEESHSALTANTTSSTVRSSISPEAAIGVMSALNQIGQPSSDHLAYAQSTLNQLDEGLRQATRNPLQAQGVVFGLLLSKNAQEKNHQWQLLTELFSDDALQSLLGTAEKALDADENSRLPLMELSLPSLKTLDRASIDLFLLAVQKLIYADNRISGMEWAINHTLRHYLLELPTGPQIYLLADTVNELSQLLSMLAHASSKDPQEISNAFNAGKNELALDQLNLIEKQKLTLTHVDSALEKLNQLKPLQKPKLLKALSQCVMADGKVTLREAELLRAVAAALDCPIPPIMTDSNAA